MGTGAGLFTGTEQVFQVPCADAHHPDSLPADLTSPQPRIVPHHTDQEPLEVVKHRPAIVAVVPIADPSAAPATTYPFTIKAQSRFVDRPTSLVGGAEGRPGLVWSC